MADSREALGRIVRDTWVAWAREQPNPKPSWLLGWDELDDGQREVDMRIGRAVATAERGNPRWRLLYTGSRLITDRVQVHADLDEILVQHPRLLVRHGACRTGGDALTVEWVRLRKSQGCDVIADPRPAPWPMLGKIAGPMRNAYMTGLGADECLAHIAANGTSTGTRGCAAFADWAGIPVTRREVA